MKILVVEDDQLTGKFIKKGLEERNHTVDHVLSAEDGLMLGTDKTYNIIILDRMLPERDGMDLLRSLRVFGVQTPILMLTSMGSLEDRVNGLESGADDYLVKPFAFSELYARINNLAKRSKATIEQTQLKVSNLTIDLLKHEVMRGKSKITLMATEFRLLEFLVRRQGQVVTKTMLLEGVWGFHFDPKTNVVETYVSRLRTKLSQNNEPELIKTVRGAGYKIEA